MWQLLFGRVTSGGLHERTTIRQNKKN
jgi:hypothetical protein